MSVMYSERPRMEPEPVPSNLQLHNLFFEHQAVMLIIFLGFTTQDCGRNFQRNGGTDCFHLKSLKCEDGDSVKGKVVPVLN
jgi:hypothetical protein